MVDVRPRSEFMLRYLDTSADLKAIQPALRKDSNLRKLSQEVLGDKVVTTEEPNADEQQAEWHTLTEMMTVLEDSWYRLDLARWTDHPKNKWWFVVARRWTKFNRFKKYWKDDLDREYSKEFRECLHDLRKDR
jgi:hypothetical protein